MGKSDVGAWPDAYGDFKCSCRQSLQDRHIVHVHGEHELEQFDEYKFRHGYADG